MAPASNLRPTRPAGTDTAAHYGASVTTRTAAAESRWLSRVLPGRGMAGLGLDDALRTAASLAADGRQVALEHLPGGSQDAAEEIRTLVGRLQAVGLAGHCQVTLDVDRLGPRPVRSLAEHAAAAGAGVALAGRAGAVDSVAAWLPEAVVVVRAGEPGAEFRCRSLAAGAVRLVQGRGTAAGLAFVRCLNLLMAAEGRPAVAATDPRLVAIAGERAAWNDRRPETWEYVMPWRVRTDEQRRLVASGAVVRTAVVTGAGAPAQLIRRIAARTPEMSS